MYVESRLGRCLIMLRRGRRCHCRCARRGGSCGGCGGRNSSRCCRSGSGNGRCSSTAARYGAQAGQRWLSLGWYDWLRRYGWRCAACTGWWHSHRWYSNGYRVWMRCCCGLIQCSCSSQCRIFAARRTLYGRRRLHFSRRGRWWSRSCYSRT